MIVPFREDWKQFPCVLTEHSAGEKDGYGRRKVNYVTRRETHIVWETVNPPVPEGAHVMHACDNPPCIALEHLGLGTALDNSNDMVVKGRDRRSRAQNGRAILSETDAKVIRERYGPPRGSGGRANGRPTLLQLAQEYGVSKGTIAHVVEGVSWPVR